MVQIVQYVSKFCRSLFLFGCSSCLTYNAMTIDTHDRISQGQGLPHICIVPFRPSKVMFGSLSNIEFFTAISLCDCLTRFVSCEMSLVCIFSAAGGFRKLYIYVYLCDIYDKYAKLCEI